ncbi:S8 family peptidase [Vallitalea okinawensis]|uniref:S8 family peptidase n=1 Tax=Vallitalea okinawensis TaxID=2078660 RepID=UPI000CFC0DB1|nr:S8 family peptidase [Vallitalea okinawensis]
MRQSSLDVEKCKNIIASEDYLDLIKEIRPDIEKVAQDSGAVCYQRLNDEYGVFHMKVEPKDCQTFYFQNPYMEVPNVYGLTSSRAMEAAGIGSVLKSEGLDLTGKGVIIAVLDTGIDYTHEAFLNKNNTTKILSIWDQTIIGEPPEGFLYGTEYTSEQINAALRSENPYSTVQTLDEVGHGTYLAGLAAGYPNTDMAFQGAAPDAELVIVKLKPAKKCLMDFYQFKQEAIGWQTNDIIQGLNYVIQKSTQFNKPVAILFAGGSTEGPHTGTALLEEVLEAYGNFHGIVTVSSAGNEANADHHFSGKFKLDQQKMDIQLNMAEGERGLYMVLWSYLPDKLAIEFISPSGNSTGKVPFSVRQWQENQFALENTIIQVYYDFMEERAAVESIVAIFQNPLPGLWTIVLHGEIVVDGGVDIWIPLRGFIEEETVFLKPDPYDTVVNPGTTDGTVTVGAYNDVLQTIYIESSRGFTRDERVKPDIVAPGVNVVGPHPNNQYVSETGTSVSSAITAGAAALLLEWGIVKGNDDFMNTMAVKSYLARGARRRSTLIYPNREWGYGELDVMNTFRMI